MISWLKSFSIEKSYEWIQPSQWGPRPAQRQDEPGHLECHGWSHGRFRACSHWSRHWFRHCCFSQRDSTGERLARIADNSLPDEEWDYIIVGAGTAGSMVDKELSDGGLKRVLVLEEGPNRDTDPRVQNIDGNRFAPPAAPFPLDGVASGLPRFQEMQLGFRHTYYKEHFTIPMAGTAVTGVSNRPFLYGRGRLAGGTSSVMTNFYVRPSNYTLDKCADAAGDDEFRMSNMLARFKRIERFNPNQQGPIAASYFGYNGPMHIFYQNATGGMSKIAAAASTVLGLPIVANINDPATPYGVFNNHMMMQFPDTTRSTSSRVFLVPSGANQTVTRDLAKNMDDFFGTRKLRVLYKSTVVGFDWTPTSIGTTNLTVSQVRYLRDGFMSRARLAPKGKLILSAGLESPMILLRNGIGPAAELTAANITVVSDSPAVGKMIENHPNLALIVNRNVTDEFKPNNNAFGLGGMMIPFGVDAIYTNETANPALGRKFFLNVVNALPGVSTFTFAVVPYDPPGRGFLTVLNGDPLSPVRVDLDYLDVTDPTDIAQYRAGVRLVRDIIAHLALTDPSYSMNSPSLTVINDDTQLNNFIRNNLAQNHHYLGSARIGRGKLIGQNGETKGSVLDRHSNVWDTNNLMVIDNTMIPEQIDCNTGGPLYAFALKQIDDLKSCRNPKSNWVGCPGA